MNAYQVLGIESDADERTIKRAYAALIKQYRPDTHPAEFAQVRAAYENVLHWLRENQQWEAQQQAEENIAEPVAAVQPEPETPAAETLSEPETESVSEQPVAIARNLISELLSQLEAVATQGNEQEILAQYREQSALMATQNLDQQLEYEQALLYWVLATQHPSLLLFAEANKRYDWVSDSIAICRTYGDYAGYRLAAMDRLATLYAAMTHERNPFLQLEGETLPRSMRLTDHEKVQRAEEQGRAWKRECVNADLEQLAPRLTYQPPRPAQMYWVDIVLAFAATGYGWLFVGNDPMPDAWIEAALIGSVFLCMPVCMRMVIDALIKKFGARVQQIKDNMTIGKWLAVGLGLYLTVIIASPSVLIYIIGTVAIFIFARWGYDTLAKIEAGLVKAGRRVVKVFSNLTVAVVRATTERSTNRHYHAHPPVLEKPLWQRAKDKAVHHYKTRSRLSPRAILVIAILLLAWLRQLTR